MATCQKSSPCLCSVGRDSETDWRTDTHTLTDNAKTLRPCPLKSDVKRENNFNIIARLNQLVGVIFIQMSGQNHCPIPYCSVTRSTSMHKFQAVPTYRGVVNIYGGTGEGVGSIRKGGTDLSAQKRRGQNLNTQLLNAQTPRGRAKFEWTQFSKNEPTSPTPPINFCSLPCTDLEEVSSILRFYVDQIFPVMFTVLGLWYRVNLASADK